MTRREPVTLMILAGGQGRRMGFAKHQLAVNGTRIIDKLHRTLAHLFEETVLVGRDVLDPPPDVRVVADRYEVRSPLVGIHAGLSAARTDAVFVVACDMPNVKPRLVEFLVSCLTDADITVPVAHGFYEPLFATYRKSCLKPIAEMIGRDELKVSKLFELVDVLEVGEEHLRPHDPELLSFTNLNTSQVGHGNMVMMD